MATPPASPRAPRHPANIALHHRLTKTPTTEAAWRMFELEHSRFRQIMKTCQEATALDERGRVTLTPEAVAKQQRFGAIYSHFFNAVALKIGNDITPEQRSRLWLASLEANAYV